MVVLHSLITSKRRQTLEAYRAVGSASVGANHLSRYGFHGLKRVVTSSKNLPIGREFNVVLQEKCEIFSILTKAYV